MVYDGTNSSFDKIIAIMSPEDINNFKPGVYVVSVTGRLPQRTVQELKSRGVAYKSRDTAIKTYQDAGLPASLLSTSCLCLFFVCLGLG
uniref:Uncharacterized protein n=1 Tax=Colobus angolensis palliatus TaxID=336983 RepID=A0A2K5IYV0_COLAP